MVGLKSLKTKFEIMTTMHKPTLKSLVLYIGIGICISLTMTSVLTYVETGNVISFVETTVRGNGGSV